MASPKLLRILQAVASRVEQIQVSGGYYTDIGLDVRLDRREPNEHELPVSLVFVGERTKQDQRGNNARGGTATCSQNITVIGYTALDSAQSEEAGIQLLADIQRAVEGEDSTLSSLLLESYYGLNFQSDAIFQPDTGENVVGARVTYGLPHIRKSGDPEIA